MTATSTWKLVEPDVATAFELFDRPLNALAQGDIPALVIRQAFAQDECRNLVQRLIDQDLLYDPQQPIPPKFQKQSIPEGYYREGLNTEASLAWQADSIEGKSRIDIGSSLGYRGSDQAAFLDHSAESIALFDQLFDGHPNPIELLYDRLTQLSKDKRAVTAYQPDGRRYGPAIIRAHYGGYSYKPHFDSVRQREKRTNYSVHDFDHQFAGVLVLQNTTLGNQTAQCRLHRCLWNEEVDPHLKGRGTFYEYAAENDIENIEVVLEPGDLYFFNTGGIHEVPGIAGENPRIVLATFIGYSSDRDEIFVWS
jgi:hypothetical protein